MAEFITGFDALVNIGPCISVFGSARITKKSPYYKLSQDIAFNIASKGFAIITGAGPGLMEAANKGAQKAKAGSCGLIVDLPHELEPNKYIDPKLAIRFRYFFVRKVMFARYAHGFVFLPGGFGTMDELFEIITLIQTKKTQPVPIFLVGRAFWKGLIDWIRDVLITEKCVSKHELDLISICDDPVEIAEKLSLSYHSMLKVHDIEETT
jgi:uncharacterized protein (TIGR00730 family)